VYAFELVSGLRFLKLRHSCKHIKDLVCVLLCLDVKGKIPHIPTIIYRNLMLKISFNDFNFTQNNFIFHFCIDWKNMSFK